MNNFTVIRNNGYTKQGIGLRQRHNERENESYTNEDIMPEESKYNIRFKSPKESYAKDFDRLVEEGVISTRGLKPEAEVFCEFVMDVNSDYFNVNGDYEFAAKFFEEAYRFAIKEVGDERYILSAVMHADERNRDLSEERGRDIFHYHMHVVYIPVVEKVIRYSKRWKNEAERGQVKEVIHQVSKSKKWASPELTTAAGKKIRIPSYSLLQDRFYEHMRNAGFDVVRGERKSGTQHLSSLEYKTQKEMERLRQYSEQAAEKKQELDDINRVLGTVRQDMYTRNPQNIPVKQTLLGKIEMSKEDYSDLVSLGKEAIQSRAKIQEQEEQIKKLDRSLGKLDERFEEFYMKVRNFLEAMKIAPGRLTRVIESIFENEREERELARGYNRNEYER